MAFVATLVSNPAESVLTGDHAAAVASLIPHSRPPVWLNPGVAVDIPFTETEYLPGDLANHLRAELGDTVDVFVQPVAHRRKALFLADMDSTMIGQECIDELADYVGLKEQVSAITEQAMRGELAFEPALKQRVALLKGLSLSVVGEIIARKIVLTPGGRTLVRTMQAHGAYTVLVSGGFTVFTGPIGALIGFDEDRANQLVVEGDKLAGLVEEPILGKEAKLATLIELRTRFNLARAATMAVGDGANDLAMLGEAGLGVAYHAKPAVAAAAHARVEHGDLTALLYAQGYKASEFARD